MKSNNNDLSVSGSASSAHGPLRRNAFVWTIYVLLGLFSFMLTMVGPMVPYLQDEFHMDYALAGLHQSAFAVGMVCVGLLGGRILKRFGIGLTMWTGMGIMIVGLLIMVLAPGAFFTLAGVLVMSVGGSVAISALQTSMTSSFGLHRNKVIMEANVVASVLTMLVPLVLIAGTSMPLGWRIVFPVMLGALLITASFGIPATRRYLNTRDEAADVGSGKLKPAYWRMWVLIFFGVSVEWSIGFWCMSYLLGLPGQSRELAAFGTVALGFAAVAGRFVSSRIGHRFAEHKLMLGVMAIVCVGFPLYWARADVVTTFTGLFLCGFGSANFYPLGLSLAAGHAPGNAAKAASMAPVASGAAIGVAPFLLGRLSDVTSMQLALWYIPIGVSIMFVLILVDRALLRRGAAQH